MGPGPPQLLRSAEMKTFVALSLIALSAFSLISRAGDDTGEQDALSERPALYVAEFSVADSQTGNPVNVSASLAANTPGSDMSIALFEMKPGGPYRVTWIGDGSSDWSLELAADGYDTISLGPDQIESIAGKTTIAGRKAPVNLSIIPSK